MGNIFGKKEVRSFAEQLAEVKNIFKTSYDQAIDFNSQVAEDNSKYIAKLKELIS